MRDERGRPQLADRDRGVGATLRSADVVPAGLRELAWREGEPDTFDNRLHDLRQRYANRPALLQRLNQAGLPAAAGLS